MKDIGKLFNFLVNYKLKRQTAGNLPLEVNVEVTNVCNFKCTFCPQSDPTFFAQRDRTYLDPDSARKILQSVRKFGYTRSTIHWTLNGEPFMNKRFDEISEVGKELGFTNQYFATNTALFSHKWATRLPKDVDFTMSVDYCADREYFEKVRGQAGSWESIKRNIEEILKDDDLSRIKFNVSDISSFSVIDPAMLEASFERLTQLFPPSSRIKFMRKTFHNAKGFVEELSKGGASKYHLCPYPWSSLNIASNGDVVICDRDLEHDSIMGNVFEEPLDAIWNGEKFVVARLNLAKGHPEKNRACKDCDMPYDASKFSVQNIKRTIVNRLQINK